MSTLIFRQLFDPQSSTYSYLVADRRSREAVLIDPPCKSAKISRPFGTYNNL